MTRRIQRGLTGPSPELPRRKCAVADGLAEARLEMRRLREELDAEVEVGRALTELQRAVGSRESSPAGIAGRFLEQARRITSSLHGYVASVDPDSGRMIVHACTAMQGEEDAAPAAHGPLELPRLPDGSYGGLRGHCLNSGEPFFTNAPAGHPAFAGYPGAHLPVRRFLSVPVMREGRPAGQISLANATRDYGARDLAAVGRLAALYSLELERSQILSCAKAAVREKEILLREIHHRVKNNLQVVSSLLSLQSVRLSDPVAAEMLKESRNRVKSMALVHEQLHRSGDLSGIDAGEYIRSLTASLFSSYGVDSSSIGLRIQSERASLPIDVAVPCGLIVHELVSNSLKHAFPGGRPGEIRIRFRSTFPGHWRMTVADNGVGLPSGTEPAQAPTLGLRLVRILAEQLGASVSCSAGRGTRFDISFPGPPDRKHRGHLTEITDSCGAK